MDWAEWVSNFFFEGSYLGILCIATYGFVWVESLWVVLVWYLLDEVLEDSQIQS